MRTASVAAVLLTLLVAGCGKKQPQASQRVNVQITDEGFVPQVSTVKQNQPVALVITRTTQQPCAKEVLLPDSGIRRELPMNQPVVITFTPRQQGQVEFVCATGDFSGKVVVEGT